MTDCLDHAAANRREELERLSAVSPNALWTRAGFAAEFGSPIIVSGPEPIVLDPIERADFCSHCGGARFSRETYATSHRGVRVAFWWCERCSLGRAVSWGSV